MSPITRSPQTSRGSTPPHRAVERDQWLGVDLRHLAALAAVARERSFSAAASELGYVQSAVSQQISYLERVVGVRLVERGKGPQPVTLTEAGEVLLSHVDSILVKLKIAQHEIEELVDGQTRTLQVGVDHGLAAWLLPGTHARFRTQLPHVEVVTRETTSDAELFGLVERGALEVAFGDLPLQPGPFEHEVLLTDPYLLVVRADSPLAGKDAASLADLHGQAIIGHHAGRALSQVEAKLLARGIEASVVFRSNVAATIQALVGSGLGTAVLPRLTVDTSDEEICTIRLSDLEPRVIGLFWHRDCGDSHALETFRAAAREAAAAIVSDDDGSCR